MANIDEAQVKRVATAIYEGRVGAIAPLQVRRSCIGIAKPSASFSNPISRKRNSRNSAASRPSAEAR
jgi:hypothetical protein